MGCTQSKLRSRLSSTTSDDMQIGWPTSVQHISGPIAATLCRDCYLPSRQLCFYDQSKSTVDLPAYCDCEGGLSTISSYIPTHHIDFNRSARPSVSSTSSLISHNRPKVSADITDQAQRIRRTNSLVRMISYDEELSRYGSVSPYLNDLHDVLDMDFEHQQDSMLEAHMFGPKLKIWARLPFVPLDQEITIQQSKLHMYNIQHDVERSTRGHVKVINVMGTKIDDMI